MPQVRPIVILSPGRTGSLYLVRQLDEHPHVTMFGEIFHPRASERVMPFNRLWDGDPASAPRFAADTIFENPAIDTPRRGFKLILSHGFQASESLPIVEYLDRLPELDVIVSRRNILASALSLQRARMTGQWHPIDGAADYHATVDLEVDLFDLIAYLENTTRMIDLASARFGHRRSITIDYETLARDAEGEIASVFRFLGLSAPSSIEPFRGAALHSPSLRIANEEAVRFVLETRGFAPLLTELDRSDTHPARRPI